MKKIIFLVVTILVYSIAGSAQNNQQVQQYNGTQIAKKIADKMKDSLQLTGYQKQQIEDINLQLHDSKMAVRNQYTGQDSLIRINTQRVENTRDSMYKSILGDQKFLLYRQKKYSLLRIN